MCSLLRQFHVMMRKWVTGGQVPRHEIIDCDTMEVDTDAFYQ